MYNSIFDADDHIVQAQTKQNKNPRPKVQMLHLFICSNHNSRHAVHGESDTLPDKAGASKTPQSKLLRYHTTGIASKQQLLRHMLSSGSGGWLVDVVSIVTSLQPRWGCGDVGSSNSNIVLVLQDGMIAHSALRAEIPRRLVCRLAGTLAYTYSTHAVIYGERVVTSPLARAGVRDCTVVPGVAKKIVWPDR
ncbi:uncharacterized protein LOC119648548 [Hermetia illucens]|uniref:uncharacterized protein LOC119648548 n=1 Tax=Hermetia illucens TaxID=343691 RepID=UPI0018CC36B8|nr:uncharacterized protein LOC119648548 [Hermetia illucens]